MKKTIFLLVVGLFFVAQTNAQVNSSDVFKIKASSSTLEVLLFHMEIKINYLHFKFDDPKERIVYLKKLNFKLDSLNYSLENHIKILGKNVYNFNKRSDGTSVTFTKQKAEDFQSLVKRLEAVIEKATLKKKLSDDDIKVIDINYEIYSKYFDENYKPK